MSKAVSGTPHSPTIRDVAAVAGVSHTLVSRALRHQGRVSAVTRAHVLAVAQRLGYRPDPMVSTLMTQVRTRRQIHSRSTLGWLVTSSERTWWSTCVYQRNFYRGAVERATALGYVIEFIWSEDSRTDPQEFTDNLVAHNIHGLIYPTLGHPTWDIPTPWDTLTVVLLGGIGQEIPQFSRVASDHAANLELALQQVSKAGYRRPGLICSPELDVATDGQLLGRWLYEQKFRTIADRVDLLSSQKEKLLTIAQLEQWLDKWQPDVVIGSDNRLLNLIKRTGRSVPTDLGLIHLNVQDDVAIWSGIDQRQAALGAVAIELLVSELQHGRRGCPAAPITVSVTGAWHPGETLCKDIVPPG